MAYTQSFMSITGQTYTVTIGGVTVQSPPPLSDNPFVTDEDDDTDMFAPVRTQSGYIRMRCTDLATWRQFIPSGVLSMPVILRDNSQTICWQGYVQTGTYGMRYPAIYEEFELPLICPLRALESLDYNATCPNANGLVTVGELLQHIFSRLVVSGGLTNYIYFHEGITVSPPVIVGWLQYQLMWSNLVTVDSGEPVPRFTCLGLLEELCKFFGWSVRMQADGIYFTSQTDSLRNTRFVRYSVDGLATPASGYTFVLMNSLSIGDSYMASTEQTEEYVPGIKSATVRPELNPFEVIMDLSEDDLLDPYRYNSPVVSTRPLDYKDVDILLLHRGALSNVTHGGCIINTFIENQAGESYTHCYGRLTIHDTDVDNDDNRYTWTTMIECFRGSHHGERTSQTPLFQIQTADAYVLASGVLYITSGSDAQIDRVRNVTCRLRVGSMYWNGTAWQSSATTFTMQTDKQGIRDTRSDVSQPEFKGYGATITSVMAGTIEFAVIDMDIYHFHDPDIVFNGYMAIKDFKIGFARKNEDSRADNLEYTEHGGQFPENVSLDTIFSTLKSVVVSGKTLYSRLGYGLLLGAANSGTGIIDTIAYSSTVRQKPEQHTAQLVANYGSTVHRVMTLELRLPADKVDFGPRYTATFDGQTFAVVSVSHQWSEDKMTVKLMNYQTQ